MEKQKESETKFPRIVKDARGRAPRVRSTGSMGGTRKQAASPWAALAATAANDLGGLAV